jgi:LPS-assembly lipoprotein
LEQSLYVEGPGATGGTFLGVFGSALTGAGGKIVGTPVAASGVVFLYQAAYKRQPITLSRTGLATGYDLSYRIVYEVRTPKGEVLQPRKEFEIKRDYFNNQTLPLAQLYEESQIRDELEKEAAQFLLRRVTHLLKDAPEDGMAPPEKKS